MPACCALTLPKLPPSCLSFGYSAFPSCFKLPASTSKMAWVVVCPALYFVSKQVTGTVLAAYFWLPGKLIVRKSAVDLLKFFVQVPHPHAAPEGTWTRAAFSRLCKPPPQFLLKSCLPTHGVTKKEASHRLPLSSWGFAWVCRPSTKTTRHFVSSAILAMSWLHSCFLQLPNLFLLVFCCCHAWLMFFEAASSW